MATDVEVNGRPQQSLDTAAARQLATVTKSVPQMQEITPRWLLRMLPWVEAAGGTYRVNRRLSYALGDGRVSFTEVAGRFRVIPRELGELPLLRGFDDAELLEAMAGRFDQRAFQPGDVLAARGTPADQVVLIVSGKANKLGPAQYGDEPLLGVLADGDHFGDLAGDTWEFSVKAATAGTVLTMSRGAFEELVDQSAALRAHVEGAKTRLSQPQNRHGEAAIALAAGHVGEPVLPETFVDYDKHPREYELSVAQTILRVHTRVADLYNHPMDQTEQQLRLTIAALRERQEHEMINNQDFGLLHNADLNQRIPTRTGPPTPDDMDEVLCRRRKTKFYLAHPRAIAAFGRECNRRGLYPHPVEVDGRRVHAWRNVPILPCNKIPITAHHTTSILALRVGEKDEGVIGLHQTGIPDEVEPSLNVRFMGIDDQAIISYLVSAYYSVAVLVPDALGILEDVEIGRYEA